jgi:hypothetical protein
MTPPSDRLYTPGEKLCVFCKHWDFYGGSQGYSEMTPGSDASMSCSKGHWERWCLHDTGESDFRRIILTAQTCPDYTQVKP